MTLKDKFAALLRRWASKLSPDKKCHYAPGDGLYLPSPFGVSFYEVRRAAMEYRISHNEEIQAKNAIHYGQPDAYNRMCEEYKKRIVHGLIAAIWERGIMDFTEERDPDTNELRIRGSIYIGKRKDNQNEITNPFNQ